MTKLFTKPDVRKKLFQFDGGYCVETIEIDTGAHRLSLANSGHFVRKQVDGLLTRQAIALLWLQLMGEGDLIDVGANIGIVSLLATKAGRKVLAVEPSALNFAELVKNIHINQLGAKVEAINVAVGDVSCIKKISMSRIDPGRAGNTIEGVADLGHYCFLTKVDFLRDCIPGDYRHLKIDVDGVEDLVLEGSVTALKELNSVLLECNYSCPQSLRAAEMMRNSGWRHSELQMQFTCHGVVSRSEVDQMRKNGHGIVDIIWCREQSMVDRLDAALLPFLGLVGTKF